MTEKPFGVLLKELREEVGLNSTRLAEMSGLSRPYVSQLESGKRNPAPQALKKLAEALDNVTYSGLLEAAGFMELAENEKLRSAYRDFSNLEDTTELYDRVQVLEQTKDLKVFLELNFKDALANPVTPYYNGHKLTEQDRQRILNILKELFPEYLEPGTDLKK